jgi:hypothetical protein
MNSAHDYYVFVLKLVARLVRLHRQICMKERGERNIDRKVNEKAKRVRAKIKRRR